MIMPFHLGPCFVDGEKISPLKSIETIEEKRIQNLIHNRPDIIPMEEIEPGYSDMVSLCQELPLPAGYVDNIWITPSGGIVIGECKLFRNPQARREVIAQAFDYAKCFTQMNYESFESNIGKARKDDKFNLWNYVRSQTKIENMFPEKNFIDQVSRHLRSGTVLILIIGDGIREELVDLNDYLQHHPGIRAQIALVELSLWEDENHRLLVVPRLPMKTEIIVRGIIEFKDTDTKVTISEPDSGKGAAKSSSERGQRQVAKSPSYENFISMMKTDPKPETSAFEDILDNLIKQLQGSGVEDVYSDQWVYFKIPINGKNTSTALSFKFNGETQRINTLLKDANDKKDIIKQILNKLGNAIDAKLSIAKGGQYGFIVNGDKAINLLQLEGHESEVAYCLRELVSALADT
jgi:hypothetical protein